MNAVLKPLDKPAIREHLQTQLASSASYTVDNINIPGSLNDQAWQAWSDTLRPSTADVLDYMDPEWHQRFQGDEVRALDFYPIADIDKAEADLWRLNRADAIRGLKPRAVVREEKATDFWRAVAAAREVA